MLDKDYCTWIRIIAHGGPIGGDLTIGLVVVKFTTSSMTIRTYRGKRRTLGSNNE